MAEMGGNGDSNGITNSVEKKLHRVKKCMEVGDRSDGSLAWKITVTFMEYSNDTKWYERNVPPVKISISEKKKLRAKNEDDNKSEVIWNGKLV